MGIWIWNNYFGETAGYPPGTEEVALIKIDRDLQLAEAMEEDSALLRWLAHSQTRSEAIAKGIHSLETLAFEQALGPKGYYAYAVLAATRDHVPVENYLQQVILKPGDSNSPAWWDIKLDSADFTFPLSEKTAGLRDRAIIVGSLIWLWGLVGIAFIPTALRCIRKAFETRPTGYTAAWLPSLGLSIFLVATLAWIGFSMVVNLGISNSPGIQPLVAILLDTVLRILPALIALALLFRKVSHVPRSLGLNANIDPPVIIGLFSILVILDQVLRWALLRFTVGDPTGGLSHADAGIFGLVFLIVSTCLVAPVAEEILYRGILFRSLSNKMGVCMAALISSIIFATLHFYDYYGFASVATFGFVCALLYQSTGSLLNVIVLHMLYNASITLPEWTIYHAPF